MKIIKNSYSKNFTFLFKSIFSYLAYVSFYPTWLSPMFHKIRGVKIKNVFNVYIAPNVSIDSLFPELIAIDDEVYITRGAKVVSHFNPTPPMQKIIGKETVTGKIHIKNGAFIGINSIILLNVTIGQCAVVGAGAVVTQDVPDFAIVAGNPAKIIGDIRNKKND